MLYVMRHGQTDRNIVRKLQGRTDIPLNDTGRQMARDAAKQYSVSNEKLDLGAVLVGAY